MMALHGHATTARLDMNLPSNEVVCRHARTVIMPLAAKRLMDGR